MFDEFLRNCPPEDGIKPSKKRVEKNIAAVRSLIEKEDKSMAKRRFYLKPLVIAAAVAAVSALTLVSVNAAMQGAVVKFFMGGEEIEGEFYDYVDIDGFRQILFSAVIPVHEQNFAVICDVDAPQGEKVRVITEYSDPEFIDNIREYRKASNKYDIEIRAWLSEHGVTWNDYTDFNSEFNTDPNFDKSTMPAAPDCEDFGIVLKYSEICAYDLEKIPEDDSILDFTYGFLGGEFFDAAKKSREVSTGYETSDDDPENKTYKYKIRYYVGNDSDE
ncbi:MAG: hypothetical protein HDT43_06190 [Ruminococcaceae bacterium]|nr:hypothetical protein [Oscillospiraceae bacterium]